MRARLRPLSFLGVPTAILAAFFLAPMFVMLFIALQYGVLSGDEGWTLTNFTDVLGDPLYRDVALTTFEIATIAMIIQLAIAIPLAYVLAYKAGKFELGLLLFLVLADELNPMVRIYAWRMLLGREGIINEALMQIGLIDAPIDALLFSKFAVIVVLSTSYLTYTVIPIYAAMKAIDRNMFEAALDLGCGLVHDRPPDPAAADRARDLRRPAARLHPALHRLRQPRAGRRHRGLHARERRQRPGARERRPERRRRDEHADARRLGPVRDRRLPPDEDQAARVMSAAELQDMGRRDRRRRPQRPRRRLLPRQRRPATRSSWSAARSSAAAR